MGTTEVMLDQAGFTAISVEVKEESRAVIAQWMPGHEPSWGNSVLWLTAS